MLAGIDDPHAPVRASVWFNVAFYGIQAVTGAALVLLRVVTRQMPATHWVHHWLGTVALYCLLWLPVQNFMLAFGWGAFGGLFFSLVSILPIVLTVRLADLLLVPPAAGS